VYAHKADWGLKKNSKTEKDVKEERRFVEMNDEQRLNPPTTIIKTPLFEAKVEPDIYFFGFDLDDEEARGALNPTSINDNPGWFFVIKERPGEPRFGLDVNKNIVKKQDGTEAERFINWNNFSWKHIGTPDGKCVEIVGSSGSPISYTVNSFNTYEIDLDQENIRNTDDSQAKWNSNTTAAQLAYILYQVPVLVGVHASRMLPK